MLFKLEIENFYCIRDPEIIDLCIARNAPSTDRFAPIFPNSADRAPKTVAFFGPNASGKSTVLRALAFLSWFVQNSFQLPPVSDQPPETGFQPCERFWSAEAAVQPTRLCAHFSGALEFSRPREEWTKFCRYTYEVCFESSKGKPRKVVRESLRQWPTEKGRSVRVFERNEEGEVLASKEFGLGGFSSVLGKVRSNASVISTLIQFDHKASLLMRDTARTVISNIFIEKADPTDDFVVRNWYASNPAMLDALNRDIERIDFGIRAMRIVPGTLGPLAQFEHEGLSAPLPINLESHGTRQFVRIYPIIAHALLLGGIAVIDELDTSIHPLLLPEIIRWFHDKKKNPYDAQLWMSCQAASLLEELQKEEVFFCEKDRQGKSRIYGLADIQAVRRSDNLYKKYLGGVYGAVPKLG
jgi:uncharacterized protein